MVSSLIRISIGIIRERCRIIEKLEGMLLLHLLLEVRFLVTLRCRVLYGRWRLHDSLSVVIFLCQTPTGPICTIVKLVEQSLL